jgi:hypothetical protein
MHVRNWPSWSTRTLSSATSHARQYLQSLERPIPLNSHWQSEQCWDRSNRNDNQRRFLDGADQVLETLVNCATARWRRSPAKWTNLGWRHLFANLAMPVDQSCQQYYGDQRKNADPVHKPPGKGVESPHEGNDIPSSSCRADCHAPGTAGSLGGAPPGHSRGPVSAPTAYEPSNRGQHRKSL